MSKTKRAAARAPVWSKPDLLDAFARAFGLTKKVTRGMFEKQKIRNRRLTYRLWQVDLREVHPTMQVRFGAVSPNGRTLPDLAALCPQREIDNRASL